MSSITFEEDWMQKLPRTILCDIDGTLARPLHSDDPLVKYGQAVPMPEVIEQLRRAKRAGYNIVLFTARGMMTNLDFEVARSPTVRWMRENDVPYDSIYWGKPPSCVIVDDLSVRPDEFAAWLDRQDA